ncbi:MAG: DUF4351 domain-containing protein [Magnetococcus sp. XQGC-1]
MLRREGDAWTAEQKLWLADGLRDTTAKEELLSFKFTESLTEDAIEHLFVCGRLYRAKQKLNRSELQCFLLLSKTPNTNIMQRFGFKQTDKAGVYAASFPILRSLRIILLNKLADEPHNAVLKYFASRKQEWKKAFECMEQRGLSQASLEFRLITIGLRGIRMKQSVDNLDLAGLTPEHVMGLGRRLIESYLSSSSKEELCKFRGAADLWQRGRQEGEAKLLMRQLTRRFGELSAVVQAKIAAADSETLEKWGDFVLDARSLEELFGPDLPGTH